MLVRWDELNQARIGPFKKSAFLDLEREREREEQVWGHNGGYE